MASQEKMNWPEVAIQEVQRRNETIGYEGSGLPEVIPEPSSNVMSIPKSLLTEHQIKITDSTPEQLLESLGIGQLTSVEVLEAFIQRTRIAHQLTNCVTELMPERAMARARQLDEHFAEHKKPFGPLHGLPVSLKENIGVKDLDLTCSFVGWVGRKAFSDASIVEILETQGAVCFVRTTSPQGLAMTETTSNLYGVTTNPHNKDLTCGGSSGGEGALLALRGSPVGIGGDLAGSLRVPVSNCGLYTLRATSGRLPLTGTAGPTPGIDTVMPTLGPMTTTVGGLRLLMESLLSTRPWESDPSLHQIPWRDEATWLKERISGDKKFRIGVVWDDGVVKPLPPIERALTELVIKLGSVSEVEVVDFDVKHDPAMQILARLFAPDGGQVFQQQLDLSGEPWLPLASWTWREAPGAGPLSMQELWHWTAQRDVFRQNYFQAWRAAGLDFILSPVTAAAATQHGQNRYWGYTSIWSLLDYPSLAFPVTRLDATADAKDLDYVPRNEEERWAWGHYDAVKQHGSPVGLQLVGMRFDDEKLMETFCWIQEKLGLPFIDCLKA